MENSPFRTKFASKRQTGVDGGAWIGQLLRLAIFVFEGCGMLGEWKRLPPPTWLAFYGLGFVRNVWVAAGSGDLGDHLKLKRTDA